MTFIHSIILGMVEGIAEFLPISSTGHLILVSKILNIFQSDFVKSFEIIIQFGAILSVVWLYRNRIFPLDMMIWKKIIASFIPTAIIGFVLYKIIKHFLLGNVLITAIALIIGGFIIIAFEKIYAKRNGYINEDSTLEMRSISYKNAFIIGVCQSLAVIPGVSRAAATIIGGQSLGISRRTIVEYSFLLAIPTMLAASGYDLFKSAPHFAGNEIMMLIVGFVVSFVVAIFAIKFLLKFIKKHDFTYFGIYRIIIGIIFLFWV